MTSNTVFITASLSNFCENVGWRLVQHAPNQKNKEQLHGVIIDDVGNRFEVIATGQGNFYKLLGNKKYELIDQKALLKAKKEEKVW